MLALSTYAFIVAFISGVIYSFGRSAFTLGLKEEAPEVWKSLGEPLGPRDYNSRFVSWLLLRRYRSPAIPAYLQSYFGALRVVQIIMFSSLAAFFSLLIASMFEPKIETHWGPTTPISASAGRP